MWMILKPCNTPVECGGVVMQVDVAGNDGPKRLKGSEAGCVAAVVEVVDHLTNLQQQQMHVQHKFHVIYKASAYGCISSRAAKQVA
jgi:hypothetical protein